MQQDNTQILLSKEDYEKLCFEACNNFFATGSRENDEEFLWLAVCRTVYNYINAELIFVPVEGASKIYKYVWNLQQTVFYRRSEPFDTLEIPSRIINTKLNDDYS